jgi:hypothetical protein
VRVRYRQRHYDYVIGPPSTAFPENRNQTALLSAIAPGQTITGIPLKLDADAPFLLRGRAMRIPYPVTKGCTKSQPLNGLLMRYTGPNNNYLQQDLVRQSLEMMYFGQFGQWRPVSPQILYPPAGVILIDVKNDSASEIDNLTLYFRGVKLYPWDARPNYTYPDKFASLPYVYPIAPVDPSTNPAGLILSLGVAETRLNQIFQVKDDADFVIRSAQAGGVQIETKYFETFVTLRDPDNLPYSNQPVHVDTLFGYGGSGVTYRVSDVPNSITPKGVGPGMPGWFFPEIYVPRNNLLKYDIYRTDSAYSGCSDTVDFPIMLSGSKVFPK